MYINIFKKIELYLFLASLNASLLYSWYNSYEYREKIELYIFTLCQYTRLLHSWQNSYECLHRIERYLFVSSLNASLLYSWWIVMNILTKYTKNVILKWILTVGWLIWASWLKLHFIRTAATHWKCLVFVGYTFRLRIVELHITYDKINC